MLNYSIESLLHYPHIMSRLLNTPLYCTADKLSDYLQFFSKTHIVSNVAEMNTALDETQLATTATRLDIPNTLYTVQGNAGILEIFGTLVHRGAARAAPSSGMMSYEYIQNVLQKMEDDLSIEEIYLVFNTPGGEVSGVTLASASIKAVEKPIYAIVSDMACSAGYFLAAATDKIFATETAKIGSIGVVTAIRKPEATTADIILYRGKFKAVGAPGTELTQEQMDYLNSQVDYYYDLFVNTMATYRGETADFYRNTEAAIFLGTDSVKAKLADEIITNEFMQNIGKSKSKLVSVKQPLLYQPTRSTIMSVTPVVTASVENTVETITLSAKMAELEKENAALKAGNTALLSRLEALEIAERKAKISAAVDKLSFLPVSGELLGTFLDTLLAVDTELYNNAITIFGCCKSVVEKAPMMEEQGTTTEGVSASTSILASRESQLTQYVNAAIKQNPSMNRLQAIRVVLKEHPELRAQVAKVA